MDFALNVYLIINLLSAIVVIWIASLFSLRKKKILEFFPFLIFGFVICFSAAFVGNRIFLDKIWFSLNLCIFLALLWILIIINTKDV